MTPSPANPSHVPMTFNAFQLDRRGASYVVFDIFTGLCGAHPAIFMLSQYRAVVHFQCWQSHFPSPATTLCTGGYQGLGTSAVEERRVNHQQFLFQNRIKYVKKTASERKYSVSYCSLEYTPITDYKQPSYKRA